MNNKALGKKNNRLQILRLIREEQLYRAALARRTGLTRAAVSLIVDELISEGLVIEGDAEHLAVGRTPTQLRLRENAHYAVGIDLCREGIGLCLTDFRMQAVEESFLPYGENPREALEDVLRSVGRMKQKYPILGVGVMAPGPIDADRCRILNPRGMEAWHGFDVTSLRFRLGLPVFLEKDTSALAIAEKSKTPSDVDFLVLLADHGLGSALVHRGELFRSARGDVCELGHTSIDLHGELCSCGNHGCAELYASIPSVLARAAALCGPISWNELFLRADGEPALRAILEEQATALATVCVNAVNLFAPDVIYLEGALSAHAEFFVSRMEEKIRSRSFTEHGRRVCVLPSALPQGGRAIAASAAVLEKYFMGEWQ